MCHYGRYVLNFSSYSLRSYSIMLYSIPFYTNLKFLLLYNVYVYDYSIGLLFSTGLIIAIYFRSSQRDPTWQSFVMFWQTMRGTDGLQIKEYGFNCMYFFPSSRLKTNIQLLFLRLLITTKSTLRRILYYYFWNK